MISARNVRLQIEDKLRDRMPGALSVRSRTVRHTIASGISAVDLEMLGGLPEGAITEFVGPESSGRTSAALGFVAAITGADAVAAWIDSTDRLDPETAAANGVDLDRLLWVRCGRQQSMSQAVLTGSMKTPAPVEISNLPQRHTGGGSPHPRSEGRDMPQAISNLLQAHGGLLDHHLRRERKSIGTPGAPNRPVTGRLAAREEQVNSDRLPPRRGENLAIAARCAEPQPRRKAQSIGSGRMPVQQASSRNSFKLGRFVDRKPWPALDQAIRTTDLLLQSGGFGVIVLDLGSTSPEIAWRIPLATWFRFRAACDRTRTSLLLLTQHACARSSAELVVNLHAGSMESQGKVMTGVRYRAALERSRFVQSGACVIPIRKPPQPHRPGEWTSAAAWGRP